MKLIVHMYESGDRGWHGLIGDGHGRARRAPPAGDVPWYAPASGRLYGRWARQLSASKQRSGTWRAGSLRPATGCRRSGLAEDLDAGRTTVRLVLVKLAAEGLVRAEHGRGYF